MREDVQHWFEKAVSLPVASRSAFLHANCQSEAVRAEVLSLLAYDVDETSAPSQDADVKNAIRQAIGSVLNSHEAAAIPAKRVGPFEVGRLLGSGGMGSVYEGRRVDGQVLQQRVAIKFAQVLPDAPDSMRRAAYRRFNREREVLASLRHPYIAGLIDAGTTADGAPYAV